MGDILKAIDDDMRAYEELCHRFGETVQCKNHRPDCYGEHAQALKKKAQQEDEARRVTIVNRSPEMQNMQKMLQGLLERLPKKTFARVIKADPALKKFCKGHQVQPRR